MTMTTAIGQERRDAAPGGVPQLAGTVALVTGGGRGIGRLLAGALAGAGASVGLIARSAGQLAESAAQIGSAGGVAAAAVADLTSEAAAAEAVGQLERQLGPANLLVNNAGIAGPVGDAWEVDPGAWWHAIEVNLGGAFRCARLVLPGMAARGGGRIVNITSQAGALRWPQVSAYSVSKAAVIKLTENLAAETRHQGVAVFSVHPGLTPIGLSETALAGRPAPGTPEHRLRCWLSQELSEGRGASPALVAELVLRLAAGHADVLSGRHLSVHDDLDSILARYGEVRRDDLYQLRVHDLAGADATADG